MEYRWSERDDRLAVLAGELIGLKVDVLLTPGFAATKTARQATSSVPIVMIASTDPVADGLMTNIARPGGNLTSLSVAEPQLYAGKRLELLSTGRCEASPISSPPSWPPGLSVRDPS